MEERGLKKRIQAGTDIAMIGIWDPSRDGRDLAESALSGRDEQLRERAEAGQLFFIETGGDGSFSIDVLVDQDVPEGLLKWMKRVEGDFMLTCASGRLLVGGLEDFTSETKTITTAEDEIAVEPGVYRLALYESQLDEDSEEAEQEVIRRVGADDYAYYAGKGTGLGLGCLCVLAAAAVPFFVHWLWSLALVTAGLAAFVIRQAWLRRDPRYERVAAAVAAFQDEVPQYAIRLQRGAAEGLQGGWHESS